MGYDILELLKNFPGNKDISELSLDQYGQPKIRFHSDLKAQNAQGTQGEQKTQPDLSQANKQEMHIADMYDRMPTKAEYGNMNLLQKLGTSARQTKDPGPGLARLLADIGGAISAKEPNSWQHQLATKLGQAASGEQMEALKRGRTLEGLAGYGITSQERAALAQEALAERKTDMDELRTGLEGRRVSALEEQVGKMATPEQKFYTEVMSQMVRPGAVQQPKTRQIRSGDDYLTQEYDYKAGKWNTVATSPISQGGEGPSPSVQKDWVNTAIVRAANAPKVRPYIKGGLMMDDKGNVTYNLTNPTEGQNAMDRAVREELEKIAGIKQIPAEWIDILAPKYWEEEDANVSGEEFDLSGE